MYVESLKRNFRWIRKFHVYGRPLAQCSSAQVKRMIFSEIEWLDLYKRFMIMSPWAYRLRRKSFYCCVVPSIISGYFPLRKRDKSTDSHRLLLSFFEFILNFCFNMPWQAKKQPAEIDRRCKINLFIDFASCTRFLFFLLLYLADTQSILCIGLVHTVPEFWINLIFVSCAIFAADFKSMLVSNISYTTIKLRVVNLFQIKADTNLQSLRRHLR